MLLYLLAGALQKQSRDVLFAARLSVCGLFFFLLIWEARSRYLVNYVPVLLLLFAAAAWEWPVACWVGLQTARYRR